MVAVHEPVVVLISGSNCQAVLQSFNDNLAAYKQAMIQRAAQSHVVLTADQLDVHPTCVSVPGGAGPASARHVAQLTTVKSVERPREGRALQSSDGVALTLDTTISTASSDDANSVRKYPG